ncbi:MAG: type II secretion system F family protein [Spirochaetota bacterium]|nr:type II secretion system F family protein [Spirochaetota bacterium]
MIFEFQALNKIGEKVSDYIDAPSEMAAKQKLRSRELYVVSINKHDIATKNVEGGKRSTFNRLYERGIRYFSLKFSSKQVGIFSRQLSTLLGAGMPLLVAITDIVEQIENKNFKQIVVDIKEKLEEGSSFSNCLVRHKIIFSDMYINMVRVGENLGSLDQVIERLADLEEKKNILKSKIQAALWYPAFMIFFSILVIFFLMVYIIPSLSRMFIEFGKELPLPTKIVLGVSDFLSNFWFVIPLLIALIIYFVNRYIKTSEGRRRLDEMKLKIPIFGNLHKKLIILRFTQNLGVLLSNKVDILKSFGIVKGIVGNSIVEGKLEEAAIKVREGSAVANALGKSDFLPKLVLGMISAGEASDELDRMLLNIGKVYETELDLTVTSLTSMIEPIIIIVVGLIIGIIYLSVMLPIFEMNLIIQ